MSSVLNIQYRDGSKDRIRGQIGIGLTSLDALVEGPIGEHGSFIIGGRQSFVQYVVKLIGFGDNIHPSFYDVQGQATYNLSSRDKLTLQFVHSGDQFTQDPTEEKFKGTFRRKIDGEVTDISYNGKFSNDVRSRYGSTMLNLRSANTLSANATLWSEISFYDQFDDESYLSKHIITSRVFPPRQCGNLFSEARTTVRDTIASVFALSKCALLLMCKSQMLTKYASGLVIKTFSTKKSVSKRISKRFSVLSTLTRTPRAVPTMAMVRSPCLHKIASRLR
jgi:hypothetical protein